MKNFYFAPLVEFVMHSIYLNYQLDMIKEHVDASDGSCERSNNFHDDKITYHMKHFGFKQTTVYKDIVMLESEEEVAVKRIKANRNRRNYSKIYKIKACKMAGFRTSIRDTLKVPELPRSTASEYGSYYNLAIDLM